MSGEAKSSVDPRWRSGRSPATPDRLRDSEGTPLRPTLQHNCRQSPHISLSDRRRISLQMRRYSTGGDAVVWRRRRACRLHCTFDAPFLADARAVRFWRDASPRRLSRSSSALLALLAGCGGCELRPGATTRRAPSRATRRSTPRRRSGRRATCATTRSTPPARSCSTDDPQAQIDELVEKAFAESDDEAEARLRAGREAVARREGRLSGAPPTEDGEDDEGRRDLLGDRHRQGPGDVRPRVVKESDKKFNERSYEDVDYQVNAERRARSRSSTTSRVRHRGGVQAHDRRRRRRRRSPRTTATRTRSTSSRTTGSRTSTSTSKALVDQALKADPAGGRAGRAVPAAASSSTSSARSPASFSADGDRLGDRRVHLRLGQRLLQEVRRAGRHGRTPLLGELPGDSWGALGAPEARRDARRRSTSSSRARSAARRSRGSCASSSGSTSSRTSSAGSATSRSSCAGRQPTRVDGGAVIEVHRPGEGRGGVRRSSSACCSTRGGVTRQAGADRGRRDRVRALLAGRAEDDRGRARRRAARDRRTARRRRPTALSPAEKLADSGAYGEAKSLLGDDIEPGFVLVDAGGRHARGGDVGRRPGLRRRPSRTWRRSA